MKLNELERLASPVQPSALPSPSAHQAGNVAHIQPPSQQAAMTASPVTASGSFSAK